MKPQIYRQGDVAVFGPIKKIENLKELKVKGRAILAHGEVTGHHHSFKEGTATLFIEEENAVECSYLEIAEALAELEHQEHSTIEIPQGFYRVIRQREYTPEAIVRVAD